MSDKKYIGHADYQGYLDSITPESFESTCLQVYRYQYGENKIYREFSDLLGKQPESVTSVAEIPFLPIELFKTHVIKTGTWDETELFVSSGTTDMTLSRHAVRFSGHYLYAARKSFERVFGMPEEYEFIALLPSYLDRRGSSLIKMVDHFMNSGNRQFSGFFLHEYENLIELYERAVKAGKKVMIWGVSFALLDLAEHFSVSLRDAIVVETGGMKGRRREITRQELHAILRENLYCENICSEYGMTELFSQAYSTANGMFSAPPFMKVLIREIGDPLAYTGPNVTGTLNIVDLANIDTCSFIATQDIGKSFENGTFEITGRLDNSDIRGCNLMIN